MVGGQPFSNFYFMQLGRKWFTQAGQINPPGHRFSRKYSKQVFSLWNLAEKYRVGSTIANAPSHTTAHTEPYTAVPQSSNDLYLS
jgi:hypothetical protein